MNELRILLLVAVVASGWSYPLENREVPLESYKQHAIADIIDHYFAYDPFQRKGRSHTPAVASYPVAKPSPPYPRPYSVPSKPYAHTTPKPAYLVENYYDNQKPATRPAYSAENYYSNQKQSLSYGELKSFYADTHTKKPQKKVAYQPYTYPTQSYAYPSQTYSYPIQPVQYRKGRVDRRFDSPAETKYEVGRQSKAYQFADVRAPKEFSTGFLRGNSDFYVQEQRANRGYRATAKV